MKAAISGKKLLFGITGSIAVYKTAEWVRELTKAEADVKVVMTESATRFVSTLTFAALSGNRVFTGMFEPDAGENVTHISLARECDLFVIAPATAQTIARLANGFADELVTCLALATRSKVLIFPAMNSNMYCHPATQANLSKLKEFGYTIIEPGEGRLACGDEGVGRLVDWETAREAILSVFAPQDLAGTTVLITAGPTCEAFDPARHLSNRSSGKMGFALARTARRRGANVILINGPTSLEPPDGIETINVTSALQMHESVFNNYKKADVIVMAAAVSDYRPEENIAQKIKKGGEPLKLNIVPNPDILKELGETKKETGKPLLVGFAAESRDHAEEGKRKLKEKNLDLIVINDILGSETGFGADTNQITLIDRDYQLENLTLLPKEACADIIWDKINKLREN
jgi:phosphopantothenoylcysteine decarboxylase/phosphopantothenate--cysteine ligase